MKGFAAGILLALFSLLLGGCNLYNNPGDYFFVQVDGQEQLPVWVRGNVASGDFILVQSPYNEFWWTAQDPGLIEQTPGLTGLETNHAVVYYDNRYAGMSRGSHIDDQYVNLNQDIKDMDKVVDVLRSKYQPENLYLLSIYQGANFATGYLADPKRQAKIRGWMVCNGEYDTKLSFDSRVAGLTALADAKILAGTDTAYWTEAKSYLAAHGDFASYSNDEFAHIFDYLNVGAKNAWFSSVNPFPPGKFPDYYQEDLFTAFSVDAEGGNGINFSSSFLDKAVFRRFLATDFSSQLSSITVPVLTLWGRANLRDPVALASDLRSRVGTLVGHQSSVIFEKSSWNPYYEEPTLFVQSVTDFVNATKK